MKMKYICFISLPLCLLVTNFSYAQTRIIGGEPAPEGAWPSTVAVMYNNFSVAVNLDIRQGCGGSLIAPDVVLTAAHCIKSANGFGVVEVHPPYSIIAGRNNLENRSQGEEILIKEIRLHPRYNPISVNNDIALLFLESNASSRILPLISASEWRMLKKGALLTTTGWGVTDVNSSVGSAVLNQVDVRLQVTRTCKRNLINYLSSSTRKQRDTEEFKQLKSRIKSGVTRNMFCAGINRGGKDACLGDSGGPLYGTVNGITKQVGIVSWGYGCAERKLPGVYTKLANYEQWVANEINQRSVPVPPDLTVVIKKNTGSGFVEFHKLNGVTGYSRYSQHQATSLPTAKIHAKDDFMFAEIDLFFPTLDQFQNSSVSELIYFDQNRKFNPILFGVFDGDTQYQTHNFTHHKMPMSPQRRKNATILSGKWDYDEYHDMFIIDHDNGFGQAELSIQSSYISVFQLELLRVTLPTGALDKDMWDIRVGYYDGDLIPDLFLLKRFGSGSVEVHVLSGISGYQEWLLHQSLFLPPLPNRSMELHVADYNRDGHSDLYFINRGVTGSGNTEVHVLDGATDYHSFLLNGVTPLPPLWDQEHFQFIFD